MFTQKISMDCTKEQYEKYLKAELEKMGYGASLARWGDDVIVNNYSSENGLVGNPSRISNKFDNSRTYLGKFNAPLFLALAAMTDKEDGNYGEYIIGKESGLMYRLVSGDRVEFRFNFIRKATVSEIVAKFGEKEYRYNGRPSWEIILDTTIIEEMTKQHKEMWAAYKKLNEKIEEKSYEPKNGEYFALISKDWSRPIIAISNGEVKRGADGLGAYAHLNFLGGLENRGKFGYQLYDILRPVTLEEIAILDSKLAEQGKFFNKETMRIEEIKKEPKWKVGDWFIPHKPICDNNRYYSWRREMDIFDGKPLQIDELNENGIKINGNSCRFIYDWCEKTEEPKKEPIIDKLAIFWNFEKSQAVISLFKCKNSLNQYVTKSDNWYDNATLFESVEQYKNFIK